MSEANCYEPEPTTSSGKGACISDNLNFRDLSIAKESSENIGNHSEPMESLSTSNPHINLSRNNSSLNSSSRSNKSRKFNIKNVKKRKRRPMWKLTKKAKKEEDKRQKKKVKRDRERLLAAGAALAPLNTNDFIIESHQDYDFENLMENNRRGVQTFQDGFEEMFESTLENSFSRCTKEELHNMFIRIEDELDFLQNQYKNTHHLNAPSVTEVYEKIEVFRNEISKLSIENNMLIRDNERLSNMLS